MFKEKLENLQVKPYTPACLVRGSEFLAFGNFTISDKDDKTALFIDESYPGEPFQNFEYLMNEIDKIEAEEIWIVKKRDFTSFHGDLEAEILSTEFGYGHCQRIIGVQLNRGRVEIRF